MNSIVRRDLLSILKRAHKFCAKKDALSLSELSNHSLHNASIFQDEDSVSIAVMVYSLSKILDREGYVPDNILKALSKAKESLAARKLRQYKDDMHAAFRLINNTDKGIKLYIQKVIDQAQIKKGSRIYEHGISLERASEMMGISQWELMNYVGKTKMIDTDPEKSAMKKRIDLTKKIFSIGS